MRSQAKTKIDQTRLKDCHLMAKGKLKKKKFMQQEKTTIKGKKTNTQYICVCVCVKGVVVPKLPTKAQKHTRHHPKNNNNKERK